MDHTAADRPLSGIRRTRRLAQCGTLAIVVTSLLTAWADPDVDAIRDAIAAVLRSAPHYSHSRRFAIVCTNRLDSLYLARWAEDSADRVERLLNMPHPFENRRLRIVVSPALADGMATGTQGFEGSQLVQRLVIANADDVRHNDVREIFCRLLLGGHVIARHTERLRQQRQATTSDAPPSPAGVPAWLSDGIARSLYTTDRAHDRQRLLAEPVDPPWRDWRDLLNENTPAMAGTADTRPATDEDTRAARGLFVQWLTADPDRGTLFSALFDALAEGHSVGADWLAARLGSSKRADDDLVAQRWSEWLTRPRFVVSQLGTTTPLQIEQLHAELLLSPGMCGIPIASNAAERVDWQDLPALRHKPWIKGFAESKSIALQLISAGAGEDLKRTVRAHCSFLSALAGGKEEPVLVNLLGIARNALQALELGGDGIRPGEPSPATGDGPATDGN